MRLRLLSIALMVLGVLLIGGGAFLGLKTAGASSSLYAAAGPSTVDGSITICTFGGSGSESCEAYFQLANSATPYAMRGTDFTPPLAGSVFQSEPSVSLVYRTDGPVHIVKPLPNGERIDADFYVVVQLSVLSASGSPVTQYTNAEYRSYLDGSREDPLNVARRALPLGAPGLVLLLAGITLLIVSLVRRGAAPAQPGVPSVPVPVPVGAGVAAGGVASGIAAYQAPYQIMEGAPPVAAPSAPPAALPAEGGPSPLPSGWPTMPPTPPLPAPPVPTPPSGPLSQPLPYPYGPPPSLPLPVPYAPAPSQPLPVPYGADPSAPWTPGTWPPTAWPPTTLPPGTLPPAPLGPKQPWYRPLGRPIPRLALIGAGVIAALPLIALQVTGSDWAAGAIRMGIGAAVVAVLVALVTTVRALINLGQPTTRGVVARFAAPVIAVVLLLALTGSAFGLQSPIHSGQALFLDRTQQWQQSIDEYKLAGEQSPNSSSLAGVYNDWGEHLSKAQQFGDAIAKFDTVLQDYDDATNEVQRAQKDIVTAYLAWAKQATDQQHYQEATQHYDDLLARGFCDTTCQTQASPLDATAYFNLAEADLAAGQYSGAVAAFTALAARFASSPEAGQIHADFAKALLGYGRQEASQNSCSAALATYQQITSTFADTPEAQQAMADLAAPQPVRGSFAPPIPPGAVVFLGKGLTASTTNDQLVAILNASPHAPVGSDGSFAFNPVPQGTYDLVWAYPLDSSTSILIQVFNADGSPFYVATVGPLCAFDFGSISTPFVPPGVPFRSQLHERAWVVQHGRVSAILVQ